MKEPHRFLHQFWLFLVYSNCCFKKKSLEKWNTVKTMVCIQLYSPLSIHKLYFVYNNSSNKGTLYSHCFPFTKNLQTSYTHNSITISVHNYWVYMIKCRVRTYMYFLQIDISRHSAVNTIKFPLNIRQLVLMSTLPTIILYILHFQTKLLPYLSSWNIPNASCIPIRPWRTCGWYTT